MTATLRSLSNKTRSMQNAVLLYFVIFSVGLCKLTWVTSRYLQQYFDFHEVLNQLCDWVAAYPHEQFPQLLFFCLSLVALFLFWALYFGLSCTKKNWPTKTMSISGTFVYFMGAFILNVGLVPIAKYVFLDAFIWLCGFLALPLYLYQETMRAYIKKLETKCALSSQMMWAITLLVTVIFVGLFVPLIFKPLQIVNEFIDIPEQTRFVDGHVVDNLQYSRQHQIGGLHVYDPRHDQGVLLTQEPVKEQAGSVSTEEQAFLSHNRPEMKQKITAGWFFFHHSWVLNPILAMSLGADASKQVLIYGFGSALFLKQILTGMGGVSFQHYFAVTFAVYPLYFFIFLAVLYRIFKRADFVCLGALVLSTSFFILGYQMILLAPGYNPMRHVFDMVILLLFFRYLQKSTIGSLLLILFAGLLAIVWSKDFGLFLILPCLGTVIIRHWVLHLPTRRPLWLASLGILLACIVYFLPFHGVNYNFLYMLLGVMMPIASTLKISIVLFGIVLIYVFFVHCRRFDSEYYWLALGLFFYFQLQLIYYIWYPSLQHFLVLTPIIIVGGLAGLRVVCDKNSERIIGFKLVLLLTLLLGYLSSLYCFHKEKMSHQRVFDTHVVHNWDFKFARFQTTMMPQLFEETLHLIEKYTPNSAMYLISKYDDILPVLTHRYNALPAVNVALDLISSRDTQRCLQAITLHKPQYVFVDTDIHRDLSNEIISPNSDWRLPNQYEISFGRVMAIKNMRTLFDAIQADYILLEKGALLSVYQRKVGV